jgi:hypothetical protein
MLSSPDTIEREFSALRNIKKDNYPKYVISMDTIFGNDFGRSRPHGYLDETD